MHDCCHEQRGLSKPASDGLSRNGARHDFGPPLPYVKEGLVYSSVDLWSTGVHHAELSLRFTMV